MPRSLCANCSAKPVLALQADGKVLAGGVFTIIGGQTRNRFARLSNDTAAFSTLKVTQSTITLTQGGSAPQFTQVSFGSDYEYDGIYGLVGTGTPQGSSYTLTGQNFLIRSRGYFRIGYLNGSETIEHNIRNVFLTLPPTPSQVVSRKLHGGTPFDINLPLTGSPGIECRKGGAAKNFKVIVTFPTAVTVAGASAKPDPLAPGATGSVSSFSVKGSKVTVNLTGVSNAQTILLTLSGVSDGTNTGNLDIPMGILVGDSKKNGSVNSADVDFVTAKAGQPLDTTNFRADVTIGGSINNKDVNLVTSHKGTALP